MGDGVTDDTAAIQAAIDAVTAAGGGKVVIPEATYLCASTVTLKNNVQLIGEGPKATILQFTSTTGNGINLQDNTSKTVIKDLKIYANNGSTGSGVYNASTTDPARECYIDGFEIEGFLKGIELYYGINCYFGQGRLLGQGKAVSGGIGMALGTAVASTYANHISKSYISSYETGFLGHRNNNMLISRAIIELCDFAIKFDTFSESVTLDTCYFENNTQTNFLVETDDVDSNITIINPFAYDTAPVANFADRVSGANITILMSVGVDANDAPSLYVQKTKDDVVIEMKSYSTNDGHVPHIKSLKSAQDTQGNTATGNGEWLSRMSASGINSSAGIATGVDVIAKQSGSAGGTYIAGEYVIKVGTNASAAVDTLVVRAPAAAEVGLLVSHNDGVSYTLKRVKVGAADSGGTGYRQLVINN